MKEASSTASADACAHAEWVLGYVKTFPDFPYQGVTFKWYSPLLKEPRAFKSAIQLFVERYRKLKIDAVAALDSRGFIFGTALAYELQLPLVVVRKAGKLPGPVLSASFDLHYGKDSFEIEKEILKQGQQVLLIDDVIATGGSVKAAGQLIEQQGATVLEVACLLEFRALNGRENIPYPVYSLAKVDGN